MEPLIYDTPIIGTRVGCGEYLIEDYINGFSIKRNTKSIQQVFSIIQNLSNDFDINYSLNYNQFIKGYLRLYSNLWEK